MVFDPAPASPGNDSPAGAVQGVLTALAARQFATVCDYFAPDLRSPCRDSFTGVPASQMPSAANAALGYVAVDGAQALAGTTGTFCAPGRTPRCYTNTDPAAIFSSGHTFTELWEATTALSSGPNAYALAACVEPSTAPGSRCSAGNEGAAGEPSGRFEADQGLAAARRDD